MAESFQQFLERKASLTPEEYERLTPYIQIRQFAPGEFVLHEGDICTHHLFVEQGLLRSYTIDEAGKEHIIQFAPENWFIGDRGSFYFHEPSTINIQAVEPTVAAMFDQEFVGNAMCTSPTYSAFNERLLQNHIRQLQTRINLLLSASAEKRYLHFIDTYFDLTLRIPQWMIASYLGITPESLSRVRKELATRHQRIS